MKELVDLLLKENPSPWYVVLQDGNVPVELKKRVLSYLRSRERLLIWLRSLLYG